LGRKQQGERQPSEIIGLGVVLSMESPNNVQSFLMMSAESKKMKKVVAKSTNFKIYNMVVGLSRE